MIKLLFITQYFKPDLTAAAFRASDLYDYMTQKNNIIIDVITSYPLRSKLNDNYIFEDLEQIYRIKIPININNKFFKYIIEYFYFVFKAFFKGIFLQDQYDYILISSPPLFIFITGYLLSKIKRAKLLLDIRDIWPDTPVAAGMLKKNSYIYSLAAKFEKFAYKKSNYIFCVSKQICDYIKQSYNGSVEVVYNGVSANDIDYVNSNMPLNYICHTKKKIYYAGNIGLLQDVGIIIDAFIKNKELRNLFDFYIVGNGPEKDKIEDKVKQNNLENVFFIGQLYKHDTIKVLLEDSDILFIHLKSDEVLAKTIPSKLFDYLLVNKPIIYGIKGEGKEILDDLGCGVYFINEDVNSLIDALYQVNTYYTNYLTKAKNNFNYVKTCFSRDKQFEKIYSKVISDWRYKHE